jgi:hypothetical protein
MRETIEQAAKRDRNDHKWPDQGNEILAFERGRSSEAPLMPVFRVRDPVESKGQRL